MPNFDILWRRLLALALLFALLILGRFSAQGKCFYQNVTTQDVAVVRVEQG